MSLIRETENYLLDVLSSLGYKLNNIKLEVSSRKELGEFQLNVAMPLAKLNHENPVEIAKKIISALDDRFINVNIAGPGFINLSFNHSYLLNNLNKGITDFNVFIDKESPKKIVIDYGGANAAKALHVGHMRSANIGESIKRLSVLFVNEVISDVHLGDIGRQSGMIITELMIEQPNYEAFKEDFVFDINNFPKVNLNKEDLKRMYPSASIKAKESDERMQQVREVTALVDEGEPVFSEIWRQIVEISKIDINASYKRLNCHFDLWEGEMDAIKYIPDVLNIMKPYLYKSEGATVMDVREESDKIDIPPLFVLKSDGATKYETRELGTLYSRITRFNPDEIWYVVDDRQSLHFTQVFRGAYKSKLVPVGTLLKHFGFGTINGKDGKPFKTRDGGVMELSALMDMVYEAIDKKIKPEITGDERKEICEKLTIATIKYTDLLPFRKTDYIFDLEKFSSLEGKTGPYIMYTLVRIKSILRKFNNIDYHMTKIVNESEKDILIKILGLSQVLSLSYREASLNYICEYLYELCSLVNKFYGEINITNEKNKENQQNYIAFINLIYNVIKNILNILAIDEIDKM